MYGLSFDTAASAWMGKRKEQYLIEMYERNQRVFGYIITADGYPHTLYGNRAIARQDYACL